MTATETTTNPFYGNCALPDALLNRVNVTEWDTDLLQVAHSELRVSPPAKEIECCYEARLFPFCGDRALRSTLLSAQHCTKADLRKTLSALGENFAWLEEFCITWSDAPQQRIASMECIAGIIRINENGFSHNELRWILQETDGLMFIGTLQIK